MKKLQLDSLNVPAVQILHSLEHILLRLSGQSQNRVNHHFQPCPSQTFRCLRKAGQRVSQRFLDKPLNVARPLLLLEVKEALERFVPQAELLAVDLVVDEAGASRGRVQPVVKIRIKGGD